MKAIFIPMKYTLHIEKKKKLKERLRLVKSKTCKKEVFKQATRGDKTTPGQREHNALAIRDRRKWPSPPAGSRGTEMSLFIVHSAVTLCETVIGLQNGHYPARMKPQKPSTTDATRP